MADTQTETKPKETLPTATTTTDSATSKRPKDRSVSFPSITYTAALALTRKIWAEEKKHPLSTELAAQRMEFSSNKTSSFLQAISSTKKYGLIEALDTGEVRVTDDANLIFIYGEDSSEVADKMKDLAMRPALFKEVLKDFPDGLPSDLNLSKKLQATKGFASEESANLFIRCLRHAMGIAGIDRLPPSVDNGPQNVTQDTDVTPPNQPMTPPAPPSNMNPPAAPARFPPPPPPPPFGVAAGTYARSWDLGEGVFMPVNVPAKLSKRNVARLKKFVDNLAAEAAITWDEDEPQ